MATGADTDRPLAATAALPSLGPRLALVWVIWAGLALSGPPPPAEAQEALSPRPYPQGEQFPLGLFSLNPNEDMPAAREVGWNIAHTYGFKAEYLDAAGEAGMFALAHIDQAEDDADGKQVRALIGQLAQRPSLAWWSLPEEQRHWRADEYQKVKSLSSWTRADDPLRRPNFMYLPGHYGPDAIAKYVDYLDIIGVGCYTEYVHQPRSWVRWRIESEIDGIRRAGHEVGRDYLNGERTPIAVPMLFYETGEFDVISPQEAYHDFWSAICAGARGVLVFSYWHRQDTDVLAKTYEAYCKAAREIAGEEQLGQVFLFGEPYTDLQFSVTRGPLMSAPFQPYGYATELRYPSLNVRAFTWRGSLYVLAVNSAERGISARISGLPETATEALALFETETQEGEPGTEQQRTLPITGGVLEDDFRGLGVHIYKMAGVEGAN